MRPAGSNALNARARQLTIAAAVIGVAVAVIFLLRGESPRPGSAGRLEPTTHDAAREPAPLSLDPPGIRPASSHDPEGAAESRASSRPTAAQLEWILGAFDGKGRDLIGPAMYRVVASINGLGMTPARRSRLRRDLVALLRSEDASVMARIQAVAGLGLAGTIEDVPALEPLVDMEEIANAGSAISAITTRTPEVMLPEAGPPKED